MNTSRHFAPVPRLALAAVLALVALACRKDPSAQSGGQPAPSASTTPQPDTIQVGLIVSLTGKFSALGTENKKAVELAIEQANAKGGALGKKIALVTRDDRTLPDQSVLAYNELKSANAVAILGSPLPHPPPATPPPAHPHRP